MLSKDVELHEDKVHKQRIMKVTQSRQEDFVINRDYLFVWDKNKIMFYELDKDFEDQNNVK